MRRLLTLLLFVAAALPAWIQGDDVSPLSAYEKDCDASPMLPFGENWDEYEDEAMVFRTMRERRSLRCNCGKGTILCVMDEGKKYCECPNNTWVIDRSCEECSCPNGVCDETTNCRCQKGYGLQAENTCLACDCGDRMPCKFVEDIKLCICYDEFISVNRVCRGCNCGSFEMCLDRKEVKRCTCPGKSGPPPFCSFFTEGKCDCTVDDFCTYNSTQPICKCIPNYEKLNGTCTEKCSCEDENAECDYRNGEKVCSCKNRFVEHNGTCVECFCGEGHSCELKNGSSACTCLEGHIEHDGICKECICGAGEYCEIVDGEKFCLCEDNYVRVDGVCKECFCGEGHECSFLAGIGKLCMCRKHFAEIGGICKECNCGGGHDCKFLDGNKNCLCSSGFSEKNGTCIECFCGENSVCAFDGEDKVCICNHGSIFRNGTCHEICKNNTCDQGTCEIEDSTYRCSCDIGFGGERCDEKHAVSKEASIVICTLTVVTLFWIILIAAYCIRKRRRRMPSYRKVSKGGNLDNGVFMTTVASIEDS